jgi:hypothetical protein
MKFPSPSFIKDFPLPCFIAETLHFKNTNPPFNQEFYTFAGLLDLIFHPLERTWNEYRAAPFKGSSRLLSLYLGLSENSVPLHPMVNDQISLLNGYNWGYTPFSDIPIYLYI